VKKQAKKKLPVQIGIQGMSDDSYSSAGDAIRGGVIGEVVQAQIEYVRRYGEQGLFCKDDLKDDMPKPQDLDWQAWLGPAPKTAWNPHHYFEWRNYSAYSGGIATDLFVHRLARIMKACDLMYPSRVVGMGGIWNWPKNRDLPDSFEMICEYPRRMTVYVLGTQNNRVGIDHLVRGYRGTLYFTPTGWVAKDKDDKVLAEHKKTGAEDVGLHHTNLHNHLRNGEVLKCPVDFGAAAVAAVVMANESWRTGQMMGWDEETQDMVPCHGRDQKLFSEAVKQTG
jgi:predicted dehydrogenase